MKEKILKVLKSNTLYALCLNAIFLIVCIVFTSFSYGGNADYINSELICHRHFYYSGTINYLLAILIGTAQYAFPTINCFVLFEVMASYAAFASITFVLADKYQKRKAFVYTCALSILFALSHYQSVDSARTAALLCASGFLLVLLAIYKKRYSLSCWIGVLEILFGSFLNITYFFIALGFAVAFFLGDMIAKKKYRLQFQKFFWYFRPFLLMFFLVSLVTMGMFQFSYSVNHATPEAKNYYEYAVLKNEVGSLPYPSFSNHADAFTGAGINSESDYELLKNGYYDSETALNANALKVVHEIQLQDNPKNFVNTSATVFEDIYKNIVTLQNALLIIAAYLALSLLFILFHKNRFSFFPLFYAIVGFISGFVLRFFFSGSDNLTYGIWVFMIVMLLNSFNFEVPRRAIPFSKQRHNRYMVISCAAVTVLAAINGINCFYTQTEKKSGDTIRGILLEIGRNPDNYYVMDPVTKKEFMEYTENYVHPMWGFRDEYLDNLDDFGYFHNDEKLRRRNLPENIYQAILTNKKIYVIDKNLVFKKENYFSEHYAENGSRAVYEQLSDPNGYGVYRVTVS